MQGLIKLLNFWIKANIKIISMSDQSNLSRLLNYVKSLEENNALKTSQIQVLHRSLQRLQNGDTDGSRTLHEREMEIALLRDKQERWVRTLQQELDEFKRRYYALRSSSPPKPSSYSDAFDQPAQPAQQLQRLPTFACDELGQLRQQLAQMGKQFLEEKAQLVSRHRKEMEDQRIELIERHRREIDEIRQQAKRQDAWQHDIDIETLKAENARLKAELLLSQAENKRDQWDSQAHPQFHTQLTPPKHTAGSYQEEVWKLVKQLAEKTEQIANLRANAHYRQGGQDDEEGRLGGEVRRLKRQVEIVLKTHVDQPGSPSPVRNSAQSQRKQTSNQPTGVFAGLASGTGVLGGPPIPHPTIPTYTDHLEHVPPTPPPAPETPRLRELEKQRSNDQVHIEALNSELERLVRQNESSKPALLEIESLRQEIAALKQANYQLKTGGGANPQLTRIMNINAELERRVYVLETANYTLSQELARRGNGRTLSPFNSQAAETLGELRSHITKYKSRIEGESGRSQKNPQNNGSQSRSPFKHEHSGKCKCNGQRLGDLQSKISAVKSENERLKKSLTAIHQREPYR